MKVAKRSQIIAEKLNRSAPRAGAEQKPAQQAAAQDKLETSAPRHRLIDFGSFNPDDIRKCRADDPIAPPPEQAPIKLGPFNPDDIRKFRADDPIEGPKIDIKLKMLTDDPSRI